MASTWQQRNSTLCPFEETELFVRDDEGGVLDLALQPEQALQARLKIVAGPYAADAGDADVHALQAEFVGDALGAVGRMLQSVGGDPGFDLFGHPVVVWCGPRGPWARCSKESFRRVLWAMAAIRNLLRVGGLSNSPISQKVGWSPLCFL